MHPPAPRAALAPFFAANVPFGSGLLAHGFRYNFYLAELREGLAAAGALGLVAGGALAAAFLLRPRPSAHAAAPAPAAPLEAA